MKLYAWILALLVVACSTPPPQVAPEPKTPVVAPASKPESKAPPEVKQKQIEWQTFTVGVLTCSLQGGQALVYYYMPDCSLCQTMDEKTWNDPKLSAFVVDSGWCTIKVNIEEGGFDEAMQVYSVPWIDILNIKPIRSSRDGRLGFEFKRRAMLPGYQEPGALLERLRHVHERRFREGVNYVRHPQGRGTQIASR